MSQTIVQINFKFTSRADDYTKLVAPFADPIAAVPGLDWKVWLVNEKNHEAGGIYLFRDEPSANAYLNGEIVMGLKKQPTLMDISAKVFDVVEDLTHKTRGPIKTAVAA
ncbi:MAG: YdhR family protein [Chloroflexota bacterium]|nr:YdhR family protein [Chloroflexota bacterium]